MKQKPYIIPEDYFSDLERSLSAIPQEHGYVGWNRRIRKPVFAMALAAGLAAVIGLGLFMRHQTVEDPMMNLSYEQMASVDMIPDFWEIQNYYNED